MSLCTLGLASMRDQAAHELRRDVELIRESDLCVGFSHRIANHVEYWQIQISIHQRQIKYRRLGKDGLISGVLDFHPNLQLFAWTSPTTFAFSYFEENHKRSLFCYFFMSYRPKKSPNFSLNRHEWRKQQNYKKDHFRVLPQKQWKTYVKYLGAKMSIECQGRFSNWPSLYFKGVSLFCRA